ncbi:MAG: hypothetical protein O2931_04125 [Planctomycetota bacterium]|nr:hypothetical protein [Planctomycetota bacterium]MDA1177967.1 hypothetical protein [Planctomycetota bacterium]
MVRKNFWSTSLAFALGLTLALVTQGTRLFAQACPADKPLLETMPGFNLYWH